MSAAISSIMSGLVETPPEAMPYPVTALSKRRWMTETDAGPIVQLELLDGGERALVYATTARDGSGPLRSSFVTMLLLEDTIANVMVPYGVCSGEATVTVYRYVSLGDATAESICHHIMDFAQLSAAILARRGIGLPGAPRADDRELI